MHRFIGGLVIGFVSLGVVLVIIQLQFAANLPPNNLSDSRPKPTVTQAAGTANNLANRVPQNAQITLTLGLSDNARPTTTVPPHDVTSVELTFTTAAIELERSTLSIIPEENQLEILDLSQPTVELFSLRGSGTLAELGQTSLAPGIYRNLTLTIGSVSSRRSTGQITDLTLKNDTLRIPGPFIWTDAADRQLILDLNTWQSFAETDTDKIIFEPHLDQLIENDRAIPL